MLDTAREIPTPEGIELTLRLAGPVARALAWLIDFAARLGVLAAVSLPLAALGNVGTGLLLILWFALEWLYPALCEIYFDGATPGKRALRIAVLHTDGTPVGVPAALTRNLLRAVDFLPFAYGLGLVAMLLSRNFQRLGDFAAGTVVVYRETAVQLDAIPEALAVAPPTLLSAPERRTILDLAARSQTLTPERAEELAELVPAAGGNTGRVALSRVLSIANYLVGRRA